MPPGRSLLEGLRAAAGRVQSSVQEVVEVLQPGPLQARAAAARCVPHVCCAAAPPLRPLPDRSRAPPASRTPPPPPHTQGAVKWDAGRRAAGAAAVERAVARWRVENARCEQQEREQREQGQQQQPEQQQR